MFIVITGTVLLYSAALNAGHLAKQVSGYPRPGSGIWQKPDETVLDLSRLTERERLCGGILLGIFPGDLSALDVISPARYIQHDLAVPDNKQGLITVFKAGAGNMQVDVIRVNQDGDFVFAHSKYIGTGFTSVTFDVWRYGQDNLITEHWVNLQSFPNTNNPSNRTMLDGPVQAVDLDKTDENKGLVSAYALSQVNGRLRTELLAPNLIQHHPTIGDGVEALTNGLLDLAGQGKAVQYKSIFKVIGKGNYVLVLAGGTQGTSQVGYFDLYRVENRKIVEQWTTVQLTPPRSQWKNDNGKF